MNSLRGNLTRTLLVAVLVPAACGLAAVYLVARHAVIDQFDAALRAKALAIETLTEAVPGGATVGFTDRFFRGFDDHHPRDFFELWDADGRSLARSESLMNEHLALRPGLDSGAKFWAADLFHGRSGRALGLTFLPGVRGRKARGPLMRLIVVTDSDPLDDNLRALAILSAGCGLVLAGIIFWLIPSVLRRGLAPLERLGGQASAIDSSTLTTRFSDEEMPLELQPIARSLNELLGRLGLSFDRERRFSADLAHELRTPLAELRSAAECALKWPESRGALVDRETLAIALQMEGMVGHMLALARSEQNQLKAAREPLAFGRMVRRRWDRLAPRAAERGIAVRLELPDDLEAAAVVGDPALARAIADNLLENAVEYTPAGGSIALSVTGESLLVTNTVSDLTAEDVSRLFERFWRKESARSDGRHVGLGLALARAFAEAMGWTLSARLAEPWRLEMKLGFARSTPLA